MNYSNAVNLIDGTVNSQLESLRKVDTLSREINSLRYVEPLQSPSMPGYSRGCSFEELRRKYYPITLGDNVQLHLKLFRPLAERLTFSPPAFGPARRPGDDFTPWQCALAEEAPQLASTVYREVVDREDFDYTVDETGQLHISQGTESNRRYFPYDDPPTAMGYLKASMRALNQLKQQQFRENLMQHIDRRSASKLDCLDPYDSFSSKMAVYGVRLKEPIRDTNLIVSPTHLALCDSRLERLKLEEAMLLLSEKIEHSERERGPVPKWYALRTPQFFYEARKHNRLLMSRRRHVSHNTGLS